MERFNGPTVERWYIKFRCKSGDEDQERRFPLSKTGKQSNGTICPFTLPSKRDDAEEDENADDEGLVGHEYQKEILEFRRWFDENQSVMSVDKARIWYEAKIAELMIDLSFMATYRIKSISPLSLYVAKCWMRKMGVEYCRQAKNYYVKRHESKKAKGQRAVYIPWSFAMEIRELCWVQLTEEQIVEVATKVDTSDDDDDGTATAVTAAAAGMSSGVSAPTIALDDIVKHMKESATRTGRIGGKKVWEFHADDFEELHEIANREKFGGKKSIAFPEGEKAAMIHGHDESMYAQNNQTLSGYVRDGQTIMQSKGNGHNEMASSTCDRNCGWGMRHYLSTLSEEQLEEARNRCNSLHRRGKQYHPLIQEASADILQSRTTGMNKKEFSKEEFTVTNNPAIRYLRAGNGPGREGNWNMAHFMIQFEDFRDFMFAIFPDPDDETQCEFDMYLEVDQSTAHCTVLPEALNPSNMNHGPGNKGGQKKMMIRDSVIPDPIPPDTKYIGEFVPTVDGPDGTKVEHPKRVRPGDTVVYQYVQGDPIPFNPGKEAPPEQDEPILGAFRKGIKYTKDQLWNMILENNPLQNMPGRTAKDASLVQLQNIAQQAGISIKRDVQKVRYGYVGKELGMIEYLYRRGFIDPAAEKAPSKDNCIELLESLTDFKTELTLMQTVGRAIGLEVVMTPICHCELAGRGVEYGWGVSKLDFRKINNGDAKKTREFIEKSFDLLTIEVMRKLHRKAREYKLAYKLLMDAQEGGSGTKTLALKKIETMKDSIKHKRQMDQCKGVRKSIKMAQRKSS